MTLTRNHVYSFVLLAVSLYLLSCSKDNDELTEKDKVVILLTKTWVPGTITLNDEDITSFGYQNLKLRFNRDFTWNCLNGGEIFSNSGTWQFAGESLDTILISGIPAELKLNPSGLNLELRFNLENPPLGGRSTQVSGNYTLFLLPDYPGD